jgi:hypothetical protein
MWNRKGPYRPDAIWQRDANFQFSMTFNFNIFLCFSNIRNHLSNFSYLVCISCKISIRWRFYLFLKTENSRRVAESRSVCVGLNANRKSLKTERNSTVRVPCERLTVRISLRLCKMKWTKLQKLLLDILFCLFTWFVQHIVKAEYNLRVSCEQLKPWWFSADRIPCRYRVNLGLRSIFNINPLIGSLIVHRNWRALICLSQKLVYGGSIGCL